MWLSIWSASREKLSNFCSPAERDEYLSKEFDLRLRCNFILTNSHSLRF